jgi:hypothetical protein
MLVSLSVFRDRKIESTYIYIWKFIITEVRNKRLIKKFHERPRRRWEDNIGVLRKHLFDIVD